MCQELTAVFASRLSESGTGDELAWLEGRDTELCMSCFRPSGSRRCACTRLSEGDMTMWSKGCTVINPVGSGLSPGRETVGRDRRDGTPKRGAEAESQSVGGLRTRKARVERGKAYVEEWGGTKWTQHQPKGKSRCGSSGRNTYTKTCRSRVDSGCPNGK